jgi:hypothetical protein
MTAYELRHLQILAAHDQLDAALVEAEVLRDTAAVWDLVLSALHDGAYILCLGSCPQDGCVCGRLWLGNGERSRAPYGGESGDLAGIAWRASVGLPCLHCRVRPWRWHHVGCLFEMCPVCRGSVMLDCHGDHPAMAFVGLARPDSVEPGP